MKSYFPSLLVMTWCRLYFFPSEPSSFLLKHIIVFISQFISRWLSILESLIMYNTQHSNFISQSVHDLGAADSAERKHGFNNSTDKSEIDL